MADGNLEENLTVKNPALRSAFTGSLGCVICVENLLTMITIWRTPALETNENVYIFSLAGTDGLVGVCCVLYGVLISLRTTASHVVYNGNLFAGWSMVVVSVTHLTLVSVDRALYIAKPFFYERRVTRKITIIVVILIWVVSLPTMASIAVVGVQEGAFDHTYSKVISKTPLVILSCIVYFSNCVITCVSYVIIIRIALRQRKAISSAQGNVSSSPNHEAAQARWKHLFTSIKFFSLVCGAFYVCITFSLSTLIARLVASVDETVFFIGNSLAIFNSSMNTVIYAVMNQTFRMAYKKTCQDLFAKLFCCSRE